MSSKIDPRTQVGMAHYEIFEGNTADGGSSWSWEPVTFNSTVDNIRPIVPKWDSSHTALLWMRGTYSSYTSYDLDIVGLTNIVPINVIATGDLDRDGDIDLTDFSLYVAGLHTDLTGLTSTEAQHRGDLNGDFKNDYRDFVIFRAAYDTAHGAGALEFAAVPEPSGYVLVTLSGLGASLCRFDRTKGRLRNLAYIGSWYRPTDSQHSWRG
jgi:hypothetical protein